MLEGHLTSHKMEFSMFKTTKDINENVQNTKTEGNWDRGRQMVTVETSGILELVRETEGG